MTDTVTVVTEDGLKATVKPTRRYAEQQANTRPDIRWVTLLSGMTGEAPNGYVTLGCTLTLDYTNIKVADRALQLIMSGAATASVTVTGPGPSGVSVPHGPAQAVGMWVYIPDVTKITSLYIEFYNSADLDVANRWSRSIQASALVTGWNLIRNAATASLRGNWTDVYKIKFQAITNAATTVTLAHLWLECPDKARLIVTADGGGYRNFDTQIAQPLKAMGGNVSWAITPTVVGTGTYLTVQELLDRQEQGDSVSFHGYASGANEPTATATAVKLRQFTQWAQSWLQAHGFRGWIYRAAWLQNVAANASATFPMVVLSATYTQSAALICWPPVDRLNVARIGLHGYTEAEVADWFAKLQQTRQTAWFYTHDVQASPGTSDSSPAQVANFLALVQAGIDGGWLEVVTVEELLARSGGRWRQGFNGPAYEFIDETGTRRVLGGSTGATTSATWTPNDLLSTIAWYDPAAAGVSDGATVSTLKDSSLIGNDMTGKVGAPLYSAAGLNGKPAISFDGSSALTMTALKTNTGNGTLTIAFNLQAANLVSRTIIQGFLGSTAAEVFISSASKWSFRRNTLVTSASNADTNPHTVIATFAGTSATLEVDGVQVAAGDTGVLSSQLFHLGQRTDGTNRYSGLLGDVFICGDMTTAEKNQARTWLGSRRGVVL